MYVTHPILAVLILALVIGGLIVWGVGWRRDARDAETALVEAGLVERGFVAASKSRGHTAARPPWIRKETREGAA